MDWHDLSVQTLINAASILTTQWTDSAIAVALDRNIITAKDVCFLSDIYDRIIEDHKKVHPEEFAENTEEICNEQ